MAKAPRLKVFTAPIGFHNVYVATPSRAAALKAWGSDHDLFARGVAFEVTDPELMHEPLAKPGEVIRRLRGTEAEQFAALPADTPAKKERSRKNAGSAAIPASKKVPRPSRKELDEAEAALATAEARHREQDADAKARIEQAQHARHALQRQNSTQERDLADARDKARDRYEQAVTRWREAEG